MKREYLFILGLLLLLPIFGFTGERYGQEIIIEITRTLSKIKEIEGEIEEVKREKGKGVYKNLQKFYKRCYIFKDRISGEDIQTCRKLSFILSARTAEKLLKKHADLADLYLKALELIERAQSSGVFSETLDYQTFKEEANRVFKVNLKNITTILAYNPELKNSKSFKILAWSIKDAQAIKRAYKDLFRALGINESFSLSQIKNKLKREYAKHMQHKLYLQAFLNTLKSQGIFEISYGKASDPESTTKAIRRYLSGMELTRRKEEEVKEFSFPEELLREGFF